MKTYIVTGAFGHLGSTIVKELLSRNLKVRGLIMVGERPCMPIAELAKAELIIGDVTDKVTLEPLFADNSEKVVIHTAGIVSVESHVSPMLYKVNVEGTKNIIEMCIAHNARMVHVSSVHATMELPRGQKMSESYDFNPDTVSGGYAKTKAIATKCVLDAVKNDGLQAVIVQPSGIIGPYDNGHNHMVSMILDYITGKLTAIVKGGYDVVDVRDVANAAINATEKGEIGKCYFLTNKHYPLSVLFAELQKIAKVKKVNAVLPMWFAKGFIFLAELYYKIRKVRPLYTVYSLRVLESNDNFDNSNAVRDLDFQTRPLSDTLTDTVNWLISDLNLKYDEKRKIYKR